jgi:hypothetical protein
MKLSDWQSRLRNANPATAPDPPRSESTLGVVVVDKSADLPDEFGLDVRLPWTEDGPLRDAALQAKFIAFGHDGAHLVCESHQDVLSNMTALCFKLRGQEPGFWDVALPGGIALAGRDVIARLKVPSARRSALMALVGEASDMSSKIFQSRVLSALVHDVQAFRGWPSNTHVANARLEPSEYEAGSATLVGMIETHDTQAPFKVRLGADMNVKCEAHPKTTLYVDYSTWREAGLER